MTQTIRFKNGNAMSAAEALLETYINPILHTERASGVKFEYLYRPDNWTKSSESRHRNISICGPKNSVTYSKK